MFVSILLLWAPGAHAQSDVHWICWLDTQDEIAIRCLREADPVLEADGPDAREVREPQGHPAHTPARAVREMRDESRRAREQVWSIPLYGMPFDDSDVEMLARASMCGTHAHCTLQFERALRQVAGN